MPSVADFGTMLDSSKIEQGLRELNRDLNFDLAARTGQLHPFIVDRQGVFHREKHICSMDRGMVPEYKVYDIKDCVVPAEWAEVDQENAWIDWRVIPPHDPNYRDLRAVAEMGKDPAHKIRSDGKLMFMQPRKTIKVRGRVMRVGWRHTFERLIGAKIEGITRRSVADKFGVDMAKYPMGTPDEIFAAIGEE